MAADFIGLSRTSLQQAKLIRMGRISNLKKESKHLRESLWAVRSELHEVQRELATIGRSWRALSLSFPPRNPRPRSPSLTPGGKEKPVVS